MKKYEKNWKICSINEKKNSILLEFFYFLKSVFHYWNEKGRMILIEPFEFFKH